MFMSRLSLCIRSCCSHLNPDQLVFEDEDEVENIEILKKHKSITNRKDNYNGSALNVLKNKEVLLILDNSEDPLENDHELFIADLENIIEYCSKLKVLLTSRRPLSKLVYNQEKIFHLYPLPKESALKLLITKSPRNISNNEISELLNCEIPVGSKIHQGLRRQQNTAQKDVRLLNHPFTELLGGHPQAISLAAPLLKDNSLKELFLAFCESNVLDVIDDTSYGQNTNTSLRMSLELSIAHVRKKNEEALNLFGLIGMLPAGTNKDEITEMWGDKSWIPLKDELVRASLLIYKTDTEGSFAYNMLPFMSVRATEILIENKKIYNEYHFKCCKLCKDYCIEFYHSTKTIEDIQGLVSIESNIWACINRAISISKPEKADKFESITKSSEGTTPYVTPGGPDTTVTRQGSDSLTDDIGVSELLLDFDTYRSLSPTKLFISEENGNPRNALISNFERIHSNGSYNPEFEEELLVIYYVTNLIFMNKNEDALRANAEYLQKPNISEIGLANLYRIYAVLLMISIDSEHAISSIKFFKKALKIYHTNNIMKGVAICQLGICKICHDRFDELTTDLSNECKDEFIKQCFSLNQNAYELFNEINWNEAASQCAMIETSLKEKLEGKQDTSDKSSETDSIKYSSMMHEDNSILLKVIIDDNEEDS